MKIGSCIHDVLSVPMYWACSLRYAKLPAPWCHLEIEPFSIRKSIEPSGFVRSGRYRFSGQVSKNGWDRVIEMPAKHRVLPRVLSSILVQKNHDLNEVEFRTEIDAEDFTLFRSLFDPRLKYRYGELYEAFRKSGFHPSTFLKSKIDPFFVCIDQEGEFLFTTGKHRLALAKAVGLKSIPVRVSARHIAWIRYRCDFYSRLRNNRLNEQDRARRSHPDLQDLIFVAGKKHFDF